MPPNFFLYIWRYSRRDELLVAILILASLPPYFFSLELPKVIVNLPIRGDAFPPGTDRVLWPQIHLPLWPDAWSLDLSRTGLLLALAASLLGLYLINALFRYRVNTLKGRIAERMLRRIRYDLVDRVLRFTPRHLRQVRAAEVGATVKDEVEPLGGFVGDAFTLPVQAGAQALTALAFILIQHLWLGMVAVVTLALQALIIPRLRRRLAIMSKERQTVARQMSNKVAETIDTLRDHRIHGTSSFERAEIAGRLARIYTQRMQIYQLKFAIKSLNSVLAQLTPLIYYLLGGWLVIRGAMDLGQLVAVIAAYRELPGPVRSLLDWDLRRVDAKIKYASIQDRFNPAEIIEPERQMPLRKVPVPAAPIVTLRRVTALDEAGVTVLDRISTEYAPGERIAITGDVTHAGEVLGEVLARLEQPQSGEILLAGTPYEKVPDAVFGQVFAYCNAEPVLPSLTMRDSLLQPLRRRPPPPTRTVSFDPAEARAAGNLDLTVEADWLDHAAIGSSDPAKWEAEMLAVLRRTGLFDTAYEFGLRTRLPPAAGEDLSDRILQARAILRFWIEENEGGHQWIEEFGADRYTVNAPVATNLLFAAAQGGPAQLIAILTEPAMVKALEQAGLEADLVGIGHRLAKIAVERYAWMDTEDLSQADLTLLPPGDLGPARALIQAFPDPEATAPTQRHRLLPLRLALGLVEPRDGLNLLSEALQARIVAARPALMQALPPGLRPQIFPLEVDSYIPGASLLENILFGTLRHGVEGAEPAIRDLVLGMLTELGLNDRIALAGLERPIGLGGRLLNRAQRQRLSLARALLKRPDWLILNRGLDALPSSDEARLIGGLARDLWPARPGRPRPGLICIMSRSELARGFDRVQMLRNGQILRDRPANL